MDDQPPRTLVDVKRYEHWCDPDEFFDVERYLEDPWDRTPKGVCPDCGRNKYSCHVNITIHPDSYWKFLSPDDACMCSPKYELSGRGRL